MKKLLAAALVCAVAATVWFVWPRPPRNLLLIGLDTLRPDHTSVYGYEKRTTPRLEDLASSGVRFADATSHAPWTLPSVSSVLTSQYPSQHGAQLSGDRRNLDKEPPHELADAESLFQILKRHGHRTQAFVANAFTGYGIDDHFDEFSYSFASADFITDAGIEFLRENRRRPFALYLHYNDPHEHHRLVPARYRAQFTDASVLEAFGDLEERNYRRLYDQFGFALYDAQTAFMDDQVGAVLDEIRALGLWDDTVIVVFSDHGEEFWEHKKQHREFGEDPRGIYGLGHGQSLYQELLSAVLLMGGGGLPEGVVVEGPVGHRDIAPTVLDLMELPVGERMTGQSLRPSVATGTASDNEVYSEGIAYGWEKKALRRGDWKFIRSLPGPKEELFDLATDPGETTNLVEHEVERAAAMRARVLEIVEATGGSSAQVAAPEISDETRKNLQALGYLTDADAEP